MSPEVQCSEWVEGAPSTLMSWYRGSVVYRPRGHEDFAHPFLEFLFELVNYLWVQLTPEAINVEITLLQRMAKYIAVDSGTRQYDNHLCSILDVLLVGNNDFTLLKTIVVFYEKAMFRLGLILELVFLACVAQIDVVSQVLLLGGRFGAAPLTDEECSPCAIMIGASSRGWPSSLLSMGL